jgi:DNA polymerase-1
MGSFRLARELSISLKEAQEFIDNYFKVFPGIKKYIENIEKFVEEHGYVKTIFGRRRPIPDIWNSNKNIKAEALRAAINAPVQGSAADIIKMSMIQLYNALRRNKMKSRIILQIHDELILNVYPEELNQIINMVKSTMEGVYKLKVPLKVDIGYGKNLLEAK